MVLAAELTAAVVANIILVVTAIVYGMILSATRRGSQSEALLRVMDMIQDERMRRARRDVYNAPRDVGAWSEDARRSAEYLCQVFATVGMLVRARLLPKHAFLRNSGTIVVRSYDAATDFIQDRVGSHFVWQAWADFAWLAEVARSSRYFNAEMHERWRAGRLGTQMDA
jgi:hypothetical protein